MKLRHGVSTGLGLKGVKIAQNVVKAGVHTCLSNVHLILKLNFNSKKLVKIKLRRAFFLGLVLKGVKIDQNIMKVGGHGCLLASKYIIQFQF